jgi:hypothetical protein
MRVIPPPLLASPGHQERRGMVSGIESRPQCSALEKPPSDAWKETRAVPYRRCLDDAGRAVQIVQAAKRGGA